MGRPFEDLTKKTEFNLGSVFKVYYGDEGNGSSQQIELKPLRNNYTRTSTTLSAVPLIRGLSDSITKNDLVLYVVIEKKIFYIGPLNTNNLPFDSSSHIYDKEIMGEEVWGNVPGNMTKESHPYGVKYPLENVNKVYKSQNPKLENLGYSTQFESSKYTDTTLEGRHGNSIRLGSYGVVGDYAFPNIKIHNELLNGIESIDSGSCISMLSVGSIRDNFQNDDFLLSIDKQNPQSSFRLNNGNDGDDNSFYYDYSVKNFFDADFEQNANQESHQILITSDRITFDARNPQFGDFTVSSNHNINFGARQNFTLNNAGYSVINSNNIYLGKEAKKKSEPMVLGEELRKILSDMAKVLKNAHALVQGVPIPLVDKTGAPLNVAVNLPYVDNNERSITDIVTELEARTESNQDNETIYDNDGPNFLSHHHYIEKNARSENEG